MQKLSTYTDLRGRRGYLLIGGRGDAALSYGVEARGISTMPRKSSLVKRFSSNTCIRSFCSWGFT